LLPHRSPIRRHVVLQKFSPEVVPGVDARDDRVNNPRRAVHDVSICTLEPPPELSYKIAMTLKAIIHNAEEGGFWAEVPALPGCLTQAETLDELKTNLREAIQLWLSVDDDVTATNASDSVLELTV
jgi:predicted RNase H-like HicB family nuclease